MMFCRICWDSENNSNNVHKDNPQPTGLKRKDKNEKKIIIESSLSTDKVQNPIQVVKLLCNNNCFIQIWNDHKNCAIVWNGYTLIGHICYLTI